MFKSLLGKEYSALQVGRFRQSSEVDQWMYDRYSLALVLEKCGLENIAQRSAAESYIPDWASFNLDSRWHRLQARLSVYGSYKTSALTKQAGQ